MEDKVKDLGDFQTPSHLTDKICKYILDMNFKPAILVEPTCGYGTFILSALKTFPSLQYIYCTEIQKEYEWVFKLQLLQLSFERDVTVDIEFHCDNIFTHRFSDRFTQFLDRHPENILILGNPPWVTNTELSILKSTNIPIKSNLKHSRGIEAITGKGNFDIAEYIILQMIRQFSSRSGKIAMLCKTSVVKNLIKDMRQLDLKLTHIKSVLLDAKKEFHINTEGALFVADFGSDEETFCVVSSISQPNSPLKKFGWVNDKFVSDIELYTHYDYLEGQSPYIWRQGVKHDAARVMILTVHDGILINGLQEKVSIENNLLYPFIKGSDLKSPVIKHTQRSIIITQTSLQEQTDYIASQFPQLWDYLVTHSAYLDARKSVIYKKRPRFSIFGIGDYAFKPYKIAISGFYKQPNFSLIHLIDKKPAILDDTSYYLSFDTFQEAFFTWLILNHHSTQTFLSSIVFLDSKRPYTKEILMRIDLFKLAKSLTFNSLLNFYQKYLQKELEYEFSEPDFALYVNRTMTFKERSGRSA